MRNHYGYGYCPRCNRIFPKISNTQRVCSEKCRKELTNKNHHRLYYKDLPKMQKYKREQERERRKNPELVKRRTQLRKIFGLKCRICKRKVKRIELHEIHGKPHIHTPNVYLKSPQDFIPLCRQCHATISWIMKYLKEFNLFFEGGNFAILT